MSPPPEQDGEAVYVHNNVRADYQVTHKRIAIESLGVHPPEFVSLQVKRFGNDKYGHTYRINTPIQLPADNRLKLIINEKEETFEIQSLVLHSGGISGGHYFSYLRKEAGWVEGNDSYVAPLAQLPESVEKDVYMLLLKRVNSPE
jgi:ubiquitin C-terminal hydrolase